MAKGIGTRFIAGNHKVSVYERDLDKAEELVKELGGLSTAKPLDGNIPEEIIILAVPYTSVSDFAKEHGSKAAGKVIVDITNPVDFKTFELLTPPGTSGAEEIAKLFPESRVVKAFNTTFAGTLIEGKVDGIELDVFIAGDDMNAKNRISQLIKDGGMRPLDAGELKHAHSLEEIQLLHMKLQEQLGNAWMTAVKILP